MDVPVAAAAAAVAVAFMRVSDSFFFLQAIYGLLRDLFGFYLSPFCAS